MTTAVVSHRLPSRAVSFADTALERAARLWCATAVIGQLVFVFATASFYAGAALRGNFQAWNKSMPHGYVAGDTVGNVATAVHLLAAVFIVVSGALQLAPKIRRVAPALHRWNGRLYMLSAVVVSIAGLYMTWFRGGAGDLSQHIGISLNAASILLFAGMALRHALVRDFKAHRRWALRLFLVVSGVWFFRIGLSLSLLVNKGPFGFDPNTFQGPFLTFLSFAAYLLPLGVLELYLRAQERPGTRARLATAGGLLALTLLTGAGVFAATMILWVPKINAAYDSRKSIAAEVSAALDAQGIDAAVSRYHELKAAEPTAYNFAESELNTLGYSLVRANKHADAIRIFQLNAESYPQSSNAYDSLAEAFVGAGDKVQGIANYRKALELGPENRSSALALEKLTAP